MSSPTRSVVEGAINWQERYQELLSDRDYWRARAKAWQERYEIAVAEQEPASSELPAALEVAIERACVGQPKDVARVVRREVIEAFSKAEGEIDQRILTAMKRLHEGDSARVEQLLSGSGL